MVFPTLLNVDDQDLLNPESELDNVVPFSGGVRFSIWPASPHLFHVQPVFMGVHDILHILVSHCDAEGFQRGQLVPFLARTWLYHRSRPSLVL